MKAIRDNAHGRHAPRAVGTAASLLRQFLLLCSPDPSRAISAFSVRSWRNTRSGRCSNFWSGNTVYPETAIFTSGLPKLEAKWDS